MSASIHPVTSLRAGRPVEWLAAESGVPATTIARIEAGMTRRPHRQTLDPLARALGVKAADLELSIAQHNHAEQAKAAEAAA